MATYAQLKQQIDQLSRQADAALRIEKNATLAKVREAVRAFGLTPEEVFGASATKKKPAKAAATRRPKGAGQAKYADPKTGATWSGFGRAPAWLASAKDRTKFLVAPKPAAAKGGKPAAKAKAAPPAPKAPVAKKAAPAKKAAAPKKAPAAAAKKPGAPVAAAPAAPAAA